MLLMKNVAKPKKPCITNPARIHLISEIPEPAAYLARFFTKWEAMKANEDWRHRRDISICGNSRKRSALTANIMNIIHLAIVTVLQGLQDSHPSTSSPSISQQQNCWFNHHPSEQYPILMSESHSLTMDIIAAFIPMQTPKHPAGMVNNKKIYVRAQNESDIPTRLTTNQLCPVLTAFRTCAHNQRIVISPLAPRRAAVYDSLVSLIRLFRSNKESWIQSRWVQRNEFWCILECVTRIEDIPMVVKSS